MLTPFETNNMFFEGINVILTHKLNETSFTKKEYMAYIKIYMKKVKGYLEENKPDRVDAFMSGAKETVKMIVGKFSEWQFFTGESYDNEAMICLMNYREVRSV